MNDSVIRVEQVSRVFAAPTGDVHALRGVSLEIPRGKVTALVGRGKSGKTTLLRLMGGIDAPSSGRVIIEGQDVSHMGESERADFRRDWIGFVFQDFGLLPLLTVAENVSVPLWMQGLGARERRKRVDETLERVGLAALARRRPDSLKLSEKQQVALARVLAAQPHIILADEPTSQLDNAARKNMLDLLHALVNEKGITVVIATQNPQVREEADMAYRLEGGQISEAATIHH